MLTPTLHLDLPCTRCTYNLRSLPPDSLCPECGLEVHISLHAAPPLSLSDRAWLKRVRQSLSWMIVAILAWTIPLFTVGIVQGFTAWNGRASVTYRTIALAGPRAWTIPLVFRNAEGRANYELVLLLLLPMVASLAGAWRLAQPDEIESGRTAARRAATHLRILILVIAGLLATTLAIGDVYAFRINLATKLATLIAIVELMQIATILRILSRIATRAGRPDLVVGMKRLAVFYGIIFLATAAGILLRKLAFAINTHFTMTAFFLCLQFIWNILFIYFLLGIIDEIQRPLRAMRKGPVMSPAAISGK